MIAAQTTTRDFESELAFEYNRVRTNGVTLQVVTLGPIDGPLVILLHGFPDFSYGWRKQAAFLAEQGYRVWVPDQRGYNQSDKPDGIDAYRIETLVKDVIGLMDAAGHKSAYLVGHDWGASVAWMTAILYPERVDKLVVMNAPHPKVFAEALRHSIRQVLKSGYMAFFQLPRLPEAFMRHFGLKMLLNSAHADTFKDADMDEYMWAWNQPGALTAMINGYRAMIQRPTPLPEYTRLHMPTLILWSRQDTHLTLQMARESLKLCAEGQLVLFNHASHWVQDDEPARVNDLLEEFLM
ncbi:MAG: alpha/beta hydrolase [Chloroflexota bacterium]